MVIHHLMFGLSPHEAPHIGVGTKEPRTGSSQLLAVRLAFLCFDQRVTFDSEHQPSFLRELL